MPFRTILTVAALSLVSWLVPAQSGSSAETYRADTVHSSLVFRVKHLEATYFWGRFNNISGSFTLDEANPAQSRFEFEVKADSVDTGNAKRDTHLKSPDFFSAVQFPTIAFKSQSVTKNGDGYDVTGELTLHGVTKPISARVVPTGKGKNQMGRPIAGIESSFKINRTDYGMNKMVPAVGDEVWINVGIEGSGK